MSKSSRAHLLALEEAQVGTHKVYNLGDGSGYSVSEVVEAVSRITEGRVKIVEVPVMSEIRPPSWPPARR